MAHSSSLEGMLPGPPRLRALAASSASWRAVVAVAAACQHLEVTFALDPRICFAVLSQGGFGISRELAHSVPKRIVLADTEFLGSEALRLTQTRSLICTREGALRRSSIGSKQLQT